MSEGKKTERRGSVEERRIFRTARLEFVPIGRIAGMDPAAAELLRDWDLAPTGLLRFQDWTEAGLHALMLVRPLIVVGCANGAGALHWLANGEVLLAVQGRWPRDTRIPALVLAHQITPQTRLQAVGAGILAVCAPSLGRHLGPETLYRIWLRLLSAKLNPLAAINKMSFARVMGCDSRRLPAARAGHTASGVEA
jgi:hypothetical protein